MLKMRQGRHDGHASRGSTRLAMLRYMADCLHSLKLSQRQLAYGKDAKMADPGIFIAAFRNIMLQKAVSMRELQKTTLLG